jgi:hypothetical protein
MGLVMKEMFTFHGLPMTIVIALIAWAWISLLSVVLLK